MHIGIFAHYTRNETTATAIRLAYLLGLNAHTVSWFAPACASLPVHTDWDGMLCASSDREFTAWADRSDIRIWFGSHLLRVQQASECTRFESYDILVPRRQELTQEQLTAITLSRAFDGTICPDVNALKTYKDCYGANVVVPWYVEPQFTNEPNNDIVVYADGFTWRNDRQYVLDVSETLGRSPLTQDVSVVCCYEGKDEHNGTACYSTMQNTPLHALEVMITGAKLFVDLRTRQDACYFPWLAASAGVPTVLRATPATEQLPAGSHVLVASPDAQAIVDSTLALLADTKYTEAKDVCRNLPQAQQSQDSLAKLWLMVLRGMCDTFAAR